MKKYALLTGAAVLHGSPNYETTEVISRVIVIKRGDYVEVEFLSGCFTLMKHKELASFIENGQVDFTRHGSNALESMVYTGSVCPRCCKLH